MRFGGAAKFGEVTFGNRVRFLEADFIGPAEFSACWFKGAVAFESTFRGLADFRGATFHRAHFTDCKLLDGADFYRTTFEAIGEFSRSVFGGSRSFVVEGGGKLEGAVCFSQAEFRGTAYFVGNDYKGPIDFSRASFFDMAFFNSQQEAAPEAEAPEVRFHHVFVEKGVTFENIDLRRTTLAGTNVRKARFSEVRWPRRGMRLAVYDELCERPAAAETLRLLYRDLKSNLEDERDYRSAGDFYYGEMHALRTQRRSSEGLPSWLQRRFLSLHWLYWLAAGYGERPLWAVAFFLVLVLVFAFAFMYDCFMLDGVKLPAPSWSAALGHSLRSLTLNRHYYIQPLCPWSHRLTLAANIAGPIQLALIAISLRRRFRR